LYVGELVTGNGIAPGTTITAVGASSVTLSTAATPISIPGRSMRGAETRSARRPRLCLPRARSSISTDLIKWWADFPARAMCS
jgi:hypothetical protein